ncbi:MAG: response regulator [Pseudomonadota bacterium]
MDAPQSILSIDDNEVDLIVHRRRIEKHDSNIDVSEARDGQAGLDLLATLAVPPDLILLDVNMPVLDGFGFLERAPGPLPPVILMLTSVFQDRDRDRALRYDAVRGWMLKPLGRDWPQQVADRLKSGRESPLWNAKV